MYSLPWANWSRLPVTPGNGYDSISDGEKCVFEVTAISPKGIDLRYLKSLAQAYATVIYFSYTLWYMVR